MTPTLLTPREDWWMHWFGVRSLILSRRNQACIEGTLTPERRAAMERALLRLERLADRRERSDDDKKEKEVK